MFDARLYHPKWSLIRLLVLQRANYACEGIPAHPLCQARHQQPHPETDEYVILSVAHLDHDRNHNRFHNLRAVCRRCHLDHDRYFKTWGRKYGKELHKIQLSLFPATLLEQLLQANGFFANPRYYLGRPVNRTDIHERKLHGLYQGILQYFGELAAVSFVEMIASMPEVSAIKVVEGLYALEKAKWRTKFGAKQRCIFSNQVGEEIRQAFLLFFEPSRQNNIAYVCQPVLDNPVSLQG